MTEMDVAVVAGGLMLGYWLVANLMDGKRPARDGETEPQAHGVEGDEHADQAGDVAGNWYRILEVPEHAGKEEIVAAYRRLVSLYHPDKTNNLGPELQALATEKSKQINAAYRYALRLRE